MNLTTDRSHDVAIVRIGETRLMYPLLQDSASGQIALAVEACQSPLLTIPGIGYTLAGIILAEIGGISTNRSTIYYIKWLTIA